MKRKRNILLFELNDFWFDTEGFINSASPISVLHTHQDIHDGKNVIKIAEKTFLIDLGKSAEEIFASFDRKSLRYSIKKAEQAGVVVKKASNESEIEQFYSFFKEFSDFKKIPIMHKEELRDYEIFYAVSPSGEFLGGCAFTCSPDKKVYRYKYGATSYKYGENDLILWKAIQHAKEQGYGFFDLGGVFVKNKSGQTYTHYKYKEKFGGTLVDFYSYIKLKQPLSLLLPMSNLFIKALYKGDYNLFINHLNKVGIIK